MRNDDAAKVILFTGASGGVGALSVMTRYGTDHQVNVQAVELDVVSQDFADAAVDRIFAERGRLDVAVHNAGRMVQGAAEVFTAEQLADPHDVNALATQRVNRAAQPKLREQGSGLLVWMGSSSTRGGCPRSCPRTSPPRPRWTL